METQTTDTSQALPQTVSDAAWKSMISQGVSKHLCWKS